MTLAELGAVLNFAIVMMFVYLVLSVVAAMLVEAVVGRMRLRARALAGRLSEVLDQGGGFVGDLFATPLIQSLTPGLEQPTNIPPDTFAQAVLARVQAGAGLPRVLADLLAAEGLAVTQLAEAKAAIAAWYAEIEERIQGEYLKRSSWWLGIAGFVLAAGFNVDSIDMTRAIWSNRMALDATVARVAEVQGRIAAEVAKTDAPLTVVLEQNPGLRDDLFGLARADTAVQALRLPVGWPMRDPTCEAAVARGVAAPCPGPVEVLRAAWASPPGWGAVVLKLLGWLITALAVMPGAKFWLDILGQAVAVRASARPKPPAPGA